MNWEVIEIAESAEIDAEMYELAWCGIGCSGQSNHKN